MPSRSRPEARGDGSAQRTGSDAPPLKPGGVQLAQRLLGYLGGYPMALQQQVQALVEAGTLGQSLQKRYPEHHAVRTDKALYEQVSELKARFLRGAAPISKVAYDSKLQVLQQALGTHTRVSRVQGGQLKAKHEIRVASVFRCAPPEFLQMIVVHELAHLKERAHDKAFYALCTHMAPQYHQWEFDCRLWLLARDLGQWSEPDTDRDPARG